jgi:RES domain-containing protein
LTPLPHALIKGAKPTTFVAWRLERNEFVPTWEKGVGAEKVGGRWSPRGRRVIYASIDPATTILEVAVHKGFATLDVVPHTLLGIEMLKASQVHVVQPAGIPNSRWLISGSISKGQQDFGAQLLDKHPIILIPSVVSTRSWNLIIDVNSASGMFKLYSAEAFGLDTRLNPVAPA